MANTKQIDLGIGGGEKFKIWFDDVTAGNKRVIAEKAYGRVGYGIKSPYDTIKQWYRRSPLIVDRVVFEALVLECGFESILDYPYLSESEILSYSMEIKNDMVRNIFCVMSQNLTVVDLSHEINERPSCCFNQNPQYIKVRCAKGESGGVKFKTSHFFNFPSNYGTHIDFPGHLPSLDCEMPVSQYSLKSFTSEAVIVDVTDILAQQIFSNLDEDNVLPMEYVKGGKEGIKRFLSHIRSMEISLDFFLQKCNKSIKGKAVIFYTGLDKYWKYDRLSSWRYAYFLNPYLSKELARYLVEQKVCLVGSDCMQLESPIFNFNPLQDDLMLNDVISEIISSEKELVGNPTIHEILLGNNIFLLENLCNLQSLVGETFWLCSAPIKLGHNSTTDNSPTRAFALSLI